MEHRQNRAAQGGTSLHSMRSNRHSFPRRWLERSVIVRLHNADANIETSLVKMWRQTSPVVAHAILSQPDVTVTSQRDKDVQLPKIYGLEAEVRGAWTAMSTADWEKTPAEEAECQRRFDREQDKKFLTAEKDEFAKIMQAEE